MVDNKKKDIYFFYSKLYFMQFTNELEILNSVLEKSSSIVQKGLEKRLSEEETTKVLAIMLFEITNNLKDRLIEVRDYEQIAKVGTFKYAGRADAMFKEGLMPEDVYKELKEIMPEDTRHIGPVYLRVKGLLTHIPTRIFFGRQMAFTFRDYLEQNPLSKPEGFIVCAPNMTGGAWIGDETSRQLQSVLTKHRVWPATPYFREARKPIDVKSPGAKLVDYVEGLIPSPQSTSCIFCFEELRTAAETTSNATKIYRSFGYNDENKVRIAEACVFDYGHPVGVERLRRLSTDRLYLVDGKTFLRVSRELGYITNSQYQTGTDWLNNPWEFTKKVLPDVKRLVGK